ncbi:hypothetical protein BDR22DRAFT_902729, partial [Usnea florida]
MIIHLRYRNTADHDRILLDKRQARISRGFDIPPRLCSRAVGGSTIVWTVWEDYHSISCSATFAVFTVACALATRLNSLIGLRFLQSCAGSTSLAIGGGTITDLTP